MRKLRMLWARLKGQAAQGREDEAFDDEIGEHIALLEDRYRAGGMSEKEAVRAARRQFGNVTGLKERQRAQRGILSPGEWWRDARFGMRMLAKRPASNAAVVLALALGIGMNTAVFTFVNGILLRPPQGVSDTGKMMELWLKNPRLTGPQGYLPFNYPDYAYLRDHARSLTGLLAFDGDGVYVIWNRAGSGQILNEEGVSGNFFSLLGVNASMGRVLSVDDDRIDHPRNVAVLSYACWKNKMAADPAVLGRTLMLDGQAFTVVGVAPARFTGLMVATEPDMWTPLSAQGVFTRDKRLTDRDTSWLIVAGRMRRAADRKNVQAEMHLLAKQLGLAHPEQKEVYDAEVFAMTLMPGPFRGFVFAFTGLLMIVFALVLLIACTNAASLLLARATGRVREMATRAALGAGRARLVRQMLVESLMLAGLAGASGVAIAWVASRLLMQLKPSNLPITLEIPMDWRVVLFAVAATLATGVMFGLAPALRGSAVEAARVLREESQTAGRKKARMRNVLVVAQMAMCVVLLAGATLCVRSLRNANAINPGFDTRHIVLADLDPGSLGYTPEKVKDFYSRLLDRVKRLPGVTSASYAASLPMGASARQRGTAGKTLGPDPNAIPISVFRVEPGLLETMGIPLLRGRDLTLKEADAATPDGVVINEYLAQRLWPGEDPVGKRLALSGEKTTSQVVGVVKNGKYRTLGEGPVAAVFRGELPPARTLVVRTAGDEQVVLEEVRREVPAVDPLMTTSLVQTIEDFMALPLFPARATGWLLGVSGILAVVMTAIGLFGVIAYVVSQRTHEIGVRMALGARRSDVLKMVMGQGLRLTGMGLGIGLGVALAAARLLAPLLYGIGANDPATMTAVAMGLAWIALAACYLPARKAMSVEPSVALRYE